MAARLAYMSPQGEAVSPRFLRGSQANGAGLSQAPILAKGLGHMRGTDRLKTGAMECKAEGEPRGARGIQGPFQGKWKHYSRAN